MKRVLIAVESAVLQQTLAEALEAQYAVQTASEGGEALLLIHHWHPDVLVIDLSLRQMDGICVLRNAFALGIRPKVIALTMYIGDYVLNALSDMDICYLIRMPCELHTLTARILQVARENEEDAPASDALDDILAVLGFRFHTASTRILQEAICQYRQDLQMHLTTQLYPAVADKIGGTATQVERGIRCAIEAAWKHRDENMWRMYFPADRSGRLPKPTNAVFLARIARCLPPKTQEAYLDEKIV